jgi:hypothetical protein
MRYPRVLTEYYTQWIIGPAANRTLPLATRLRSRTGDQDPHGGGMSPACGLELPPMRQKALVWTHSISRGPFRASGYSIVDAGSMTLAGWRPLMVVYTVESYTRYLELRHAPFSDS